MSRPFFNSTIAELEQMFEQRSNEPQFREQLHEELAHRTTQRAERLKKRLIALEESTPHVYSKKTMENMLAPTPVKGKKTTTQNIPYGAVDTCPASEKVQPKIEASQETKATLDIRSVEPMSLNLPPVVDNSHTYSGPESVLNTWTAIEVLSPATFLKPESLGDGSPYSVVKFSNGPMPWEDGQKRYRKGYRLYYQIILGTISMEPAIDALLKVYTDTRVQRPTPRGEAVLASVMVDTEGHLAGQNPLVISSFGWGVPVALAGDLRNLEQWPLAEQKLIETLTEKLTVQDEDGNPLALTAHHIAEAFTWLTGTLSLPPELVNKPYFALCSYQWNPLPDAPDPVLLNSFYLKDLTWAKAMAQAGTLPANIKRYFGVTAPEARWNLMHSHDAVRRVLSPARFPVASWPGKGRYPLAPLQQCAVNIALSDLKNGGILAVNGPPGTGKTTLLRDIVAAIVTERAKILATYTDPENAFSTTGHKLKRGSAFLHMYAVEKKLRGFEIVVASSNNKAVENVSVELPGRNAVAEDSFAEGYFSTVASALFSNDTWGVISAVLGNAKNRSEFRKTFWWDQDCGMHGYLKHACGTPVYYTDDKGLQCTPRIIQQEKPPMNHEEALLRWEKARKHFQHTLAKTESSLVNLQKIHDLYDSICHRHTEINKVREKLSALEKQLLPVENSFLLAQDVFSEKQALFSAATNQHKSAETDKPGFFSQLFLRARYRSWLAMHDQAALQLENAKKEYLQTKTDLEAVIVQKQALSELIQKNTKAIQILSWELDKKTEEYAMLATGYAGAFVDASFFSKSHEERQITPPWLDTQTARLRGDLFEAALALHKAFVDGAAQKIRHNCSIFLENYGSKSLGSPEKDSFIPDLWTTFFMVVPVVSTTFASVGNMLSGLGQEDLGWLLIDEAGQALPQAAIGALMRTKRAVVVGDPLQIEPIVVLPESLTEKICDNFSVDCAIYNPPGASVQTLADRATGYIGSFETQFGTREVGVPLLVHRRCAEPMFSISNAVAYENLMVQAKRPQPSTILEVAGPSRWIHVSGSAQGKWCPQEGQSAVQLLQTIRTGGCNPDFYIVTPFVDVQNGLRSLLATSPVLSGWVPEPREWVKERIGTVHTVQGREAEAVIFVLGAPEAGQNGARIWAGKSPNLLNVAVTRAKEAVYVIGNATAWKDCGVFQTLHKRLIH